MKIDQKLLKIMGLVAGSFILLIIIIALVSGCTKNKKYSLGEAEAKIISLAKKYYQSNDSSLPRDGENTTLSVGHFISEGKIKSLRLTSGEDCTGEVVISNNNGYYLYVPKLTCGTDIKPQTLYSKLTEENNLVTTGPGLYKYGSSFLYRGDVINNYVSFADKNWQIIKINPDNSIRIIEAKKSETTKWDDRYNLDKNTYSGINDFIINNNNSRIKDRLEEAYKNSELYTDDQRAYFVKQDLCVGKRNETDTINDGSIECSDVLKDQMFGLVTVNEYLTASLDANCKDITSPSCTNYNYLANLPSTIWTLTADKSSSYKVYKLSGSLSLSNASGTSGIAVVAHLSKEVLYQSGTGTENDPFILK